MTKRKASEPMQIFGSADIAVALDVGRAAVSNWLTRYPDTPSPTAVTPDGRQYWDLDGLRQWRDWYAEMHNRKRAPRADQGAAEQRRRAVIADVLESLDK